MRVLVAFLLALACFSSCDMLTPASSSSTDASDTGSVETSSSEEASSSESQTDSSSSVEEEEVDTFEVYESQDIPYYMNMGIDKLVLRLENDVVFEDPYSITPHPMSNLVEELVIEGNGYSMTFLETSGVYQAISLTKTGAKIVINDLTIINEKTGGTPNDRKIIYTSINATTVEYNHCTFDGPVRFMNNAKCTNCTFNNENDTSGIDRYMIFFEPEDGTAYTLTLDGCTLSAPTGTYGLLKVYDQARAGIKVHVKNSTFAENVSWASDMYVDGNVQITLEGTNVFSNNGSKALKASSDGVTVNGVAIERAVLYTAEDLANLA